MNARAVGFVMSSSTVAAVARILIIAGGERGRELAAGLLAEGHAVRMTTRDRIVGYGEKVGTEIGFMFADSSFFNVFSFPLLEGDSHTALSGPRKVILTESTARRYFGATDPLGE